jgi:hypothetical protein
MAGAIGPAYSESEIGALEAQVLPKYLSIFHSLALGKLTLSSNAKVATLGLLASSLKTSIAALHPSAEVEPLSAIPIPHGDKSFSHAVAVHPLTPPAERRRLFNELFRVLGQDGQLALAIPLRGSYPEVSDMLREYALKSDSTRVAEAVEIAAQSRPTPETLTEELEGVGFDDVSVSLELLSVPFESGKDFVGHPLLSLVVGRDVAAALGLPRETVDPALAYVEEAIGKYWSEGPFELAVNLGCVSATKR